MKKPRPKHTKAKTKARQGRVLVVTSGKGGVGKHAVALFNPGGTRIKSFGAPTEEELAQDFLWRVEKEAPQPGQITIFDRSHYEDVLIVRVKGVIAESVWRHRYRMINEFEHTLTLNNTTIIKFFLYISKD